MSAVFILRLSNLSTKYFGFLQLVWFGCRIDHSNDGVSDFRRSRVKNSLTVCCRVVVILLLPYFGDARGWFVTKSGLNLILILISSHLVACSQEIPTSKTQTASQGTEGTSGLNPSPNLGDSGGTGGGVASPLYTSGQVYGSCLVKYDDQFRATYADAQPTFPVLTCSTVGEPTCASGFQLVIDTPTQMNCSSNPGPNNVLNCFFKRFRCAKLDDVNANKNYIAGQDYGLCLRQLNSAFSAVGPVTAVAPISNCTTGTTEPTCPSGFRLVSDTPVQMNCSNNPSASVVPCYYKAQRCMRL